MSQFKRVEDGIFIAPQPTEQAFSEAKRMGFDLKSSPEFSTFVTQTIDQTRPSLCQPSTVISLTGVTA